MELYKIAQNEMDFTNPQVRRVDGALSEISFTVKSAIEKMNGFSPDVDPATVVESLSYELAMIQQSLNIVSDPS